MSNVWPKDFILEKLLPLFERIVFQYALLSKVTLAIATLNRELSYRHYDKN